ncbi:MAG: DoxX family protein [Solirubrobacterales bacterium]
MGRLFGPFFVFAGIMHFLKTRAYERIVPPYLSRPREIVYVSGVAEIAGGLATMHPRTRRAGSAWSIATLLAVFPANVHMAIEAERFEKGVPGGRNALYARLPVQLLFIAWAYAAGNWNENG